MGKALARLLALRLFVQQLKLGLKFPNCALLITLIALVLAAYV
jgi:hypothetical protein